MIYRKYQTTLPVSCAELTAYALGEAGFDGVEIEDSLPLTEAELSAMFVDIPPEPKEQDGLATLSVYLPEDGPSEEEVELRFRNAFAEVRDFLPELPENPEIRRFTSRDEDWANNWKAYFHGLTIKDLQIVPSWEKDRAEGPGPFLFIDPGAAFGTGGHETTRLCIETLQHILSHKLKPLSLLDIGTGSGILSIVGMLYGADFAVGTDLDPLAILSARENAEKNGIASECFVLLSGNVVTDPGFREQVLETGKNLAAGDFAGYDLICANILAEVLLPMIPHAPGLLAPGGQLILSGILREKAEKIENALRQAELTPVATRFLGDWAMVLAKKPES